MSDSRKIKRFFLLLRQSLMLIITLMILNFNSIKVQAITYIEDTSDSLIQWGLDNENLTSGYYKVTINGQTYPIHLYVYEGDQVWDRDMTFGDSGDVGTSSAYAANSVMVIVKGDLTIDSGVTVTTYRSSYGGPKGLFLIVSGNLTNNGAISMTARGAYAAGQNVYLWKNLDESYEYVPATGASGGAAKTVSGSGTTANGNAGGAGSNRKTGGGGTGAGRSWSQKAYIAAGGTGTSFSGGSGSGAANSDGSGGCNAYSGAGSSVGGAGGIGAVCSSNSSGYGQISIGGTGNPSGSYKTYRISAKTYTKREGTGGLLVMYASSLTNNGSITANGVSSSTATRSNTNGRVDTGGASGGGSINIFYGLLSKKGTITAAGGTALYGEGGAAGGAGGAGTVTTTQLILEEEYLNPTLSFLEVENQTMYPTFDSTTYAYGVTLDSEDSTVKINATLTNEDNAITSGIGYVDVPIGTSTHNVVLTSKVGIVKMYTIEFYRAPSSYKYLKGITINGEEIENFNPEKLTYNVTIPYNFDAFELDVLRGRTSQEVYGTGTTISKSGNNSYTITVVSEDGNYTTNYTLNVFREHSTKLKSLTIADYDLEPVFDPETNSYTVTVMSTTLALSLNAIAYDEEATITLKGFGYIKSSQTGTITVTEPNSTSTTYTINIVKEGIPTIVEYNYAYTGSYQTFTAPATGFYQIELWGAQGGNSVGNNSRTCSYNRGNAYGSGCGGFGAYTTGTIKLQKGETLYVYVGQRGLNGLAHNNRVGGWNGGGSSTYDHSDDEASGSGGGATDIRLVPTSQTTTWNEFASLKSRIMVAAGGGGGSDVYAAGSGGTLTSSSARFSKGATQTSGYAFGYGENSVYRRSNIDVAGGGGGYFGGYSTATSSSNYGNFGQVGTGGTSFVSGCTNCVAIDESSTSQSNLIFTNSNVHYSGYEFTDIKMIAGGSSMPTTGTGYSVGNVSNGYAKITLVNKSENNFLTSLTVKVDSEKKTYTPDFDMEVEDYYLTLTENETEISISAKPEDSTATIAGLGNYDIPAGTTDIPITVTAENGNIKVYTVHVTRPASQDPYPLDIKISGLVPSLCSVNSSLCNLTPETFDKDTDTYYITVPSRIKQLWFDVEKSHPYQTVVGDGKTSLDGGENIITIEVTSEDGLSSKVYKYYVTRDMTGNTDLSKLEIIDPERDINFEPDILSYYLSVPNEYTEIRELVIETDDENATYIVSGNENFQTGMNEINILVTAENGETKTYTLNVYREKSENVYLESLIVQSTSGITYNLTPEFNKTYLGTYNVVVPNDVIDIEIIANPEDPNTEVSNAGLKSLKTGLNSYSIITTSENGNIETYQLSITREKNNNANLIGITVEDETKEYELLPTFDKDTLEYTVTVDEGVSKINIDAIPEISTTTYKLLDNDTIKVGTNTKRIMAIAEDGTTKTYNIIITRPANSNNYLESLTVKNGENEYELTPTFNKETNSYTLLLENEINTVDILGIPESNLSKVDGNGKYSIAVGENEISLTVTSESNDERTYTIIVTRKPNSNSYLASITTSTGILVPTFDKETYDYVMNVSSTVDTIKVEGIPEVSTTKVVGNATYKLLTGENIITLVTVAEDLVNTKTYTIKIEKDKSNNANISELYLEEGVLSPTFDKSITEYTTQVPWNVISTHFHVTLENANASYIISGNENFQTGENQVTIVVTAEDGTVKNYNITVNQRVAPTNSDYLSSLTVDKGTLTPEFDKEIQYYVVDVPYDVTDINVEATAEDSYAIVTGTGKYNLSVGNNLISVKVTSAEGIDRDYQIMVRRAKNTDARLSNLVVKGSTILPNFDKDTYIYSLDTTESSLTFTTITTVDKNATYEIIDNNFSSAGTYVITIRVTAEDGITTKDYTLNVTKNLSSNNNLKSLKIDGYTLSPTFNKSTTLYMVTVPNEVKMVNIEAIPEHANATVTGDGSTTIYSGENQLMIDVTSEDGNVKTYIILLTKEGDSNNYLANLVVNNGIMSPEFNKETLTYNVTVPYSETALDLEIILDSYHSYYEVIDNNLSVGNNTVQIMVTNENGQVRIYTLNVIREDIVSALLENIEIKNYELSPSFNSYINNYDVLVDYEITSLDLKVTPLDKKATYVVSGNENFQIGTNTITITVTSSDKGTTEIYTLNVNRQAYSNTYLDYLYTSQGDVIPDFDKETLSYTINVSNEIDTIELFAEAIDKSATVTGLGEHTLNTGTTKLPITVTSTTGIKRTYYVTVNRAKSHTNYLESLVVKVDDKVYELTPAFIKTTNNYTLDVPVGSTNIEFIGTISDNAKVAGLGTKTLKVGENTFKIIVTSESGIENTYTINVNREASSNNYLTDLIPSVGTLSPLFNYTETEYTLDLDSAAGILSFTYYVEDSTAKVTGANAEAVPDGISTREIIVTSEDGNIRTYTITINKEKADNAYLKDLSVTNYPFDISFDKETDTYKITVPNSKNVLLGTEVIAVAEDSNATISKPSTLNLATGRNTYTITVTAPNGFTKKDYHIIVDRELGSNSLLTSLSVKTGTIAPNFKPSTKVYEWTVEKGTIVTPNDIIATLADVNATMTMTESLEILTVSGNTFEIVITSEDKTSTTTYTLNVTYNLESDASLSNIIIDKGYYVPKFNPDTFVYDVYEYVDETEITVDAKATADTSTIESGIGKVYLDSNLVVNEIVVTAEDGTVLTYTLNIHKTILNDKGLKNIILNGLENLDCTNNKCKLSPTFDSDIIAYNIKVPYEYTNLDILTVKMNEQQSVKYRINDTYIESYELPLGKTEVVIEVYDGMNIKTREYTLNVERCKSNNNNLTNITVSYNDGEETILDLEPEFAKDTLEYTVTIPYEIEEVKITATKEDSDAYVSINGYNYLEVGNNDATVEVTAADGTVKTYIIHIIRLPLYNSYLKNITVSTGVFWDLSPKFKSTTFNYTAKVTESYDTVTIEAIPVSSDTLVSGTGEYNIVVGNNEFVIVATAIDGSISTYRINVIKENSRNVNLENLIVEEGNLSPKFESGITKYDVNVDSDVDKLTIHAILADSSSSYIITGNEHLVSGENIVNVIVMSQDKSATKTYQLKVYKALSNNSFLSNIIVRDEDTRYQLNPSFNKENYFYQVDLGPDVEKVTIEAIANHDLATITGVGEEYLAFGNNQKEIIVTAEDGTASVYTINLYRNYNLNLKLIMSDVGTLSPDFDKDITEYSMTVPTEIDEITFIAQKESSKVVVTGSGTYDLNYGENVIEFIVTAPDNKTKTYTVKVTRESSDNNYIESLFVHEGILSPVFDRDTTSYEVSVKNTFTKVGMDITLEDENATYEVIGNNNLTKGNNEVIIRVTAQNGDIRNYKINVILQEDNYFSNYLLDISITNGKLNPDFDKETNYYAATVANSITTTEITVIKESVDATVTGIGVKSLKLGKNVFQIPVTSKDGIVNTYTLVIYRNENSDATLSSLVVKDYNYLPIFNKLEENYTLEVDSSTTKLDITAVPTDPNSKVEIIGNKNFVHGENKVQIKVTAPDNLTTKTYTITVNKNLSTNNYLSTLEVLGYNLTPNYSKTNLGPYVVNVDSNVNTVVVEATAEEETTTITGLGSYTLTSGQNVITVNSTSEQGEVRVYTIIINKSKNSDSSLKNIIVSDSNLEPSFSSETLEYVVNVSNDLENITVTGILNNSNATITGNGLYTLEENETIIELVVTAEDSSTTTYKVKVIKDISNSSKISNLVIKEGELYPNFHKNTTNYTVLVPNEVTSLKDMEITLEDENATYEVIGNENFIIGNNVVTIRVTSKDKTSTTDYIINVSRQVVASNYLKDLEVVGYTLTPEFDKETLYYVVNVPSDVENVQINATKEDSQATLTGTGYKTLNYSENRFYITVTSTSGVVRTYSVVVNRTLTSDNLLLTLESNVGVFSPAFEPYTNTYDLLVPEKTTTLTLSGTSSPNTTVVGLGMSNVVAGLQTRTISVTSQSGDVNIYTVNINRPPSTNTELISLTPSVGTLDYSNDIFDYILIVEDSNSIISFDAILKDSDATISGTEVSTLQYGENEITITVTAEDGITQRIINVKVIREKEIIAIIPSETDLILSVGEEKEITYILDPSDTSYTEVEWISSDEGIVSVTSDGKLTALDIGSATIQIRSTHNPLIYANITVSVINKEITSKVYEINRETDEKYVIGIEPKTNLTDFIDSFDNNPSTLYVYDKEGNEITDVDELIGSYMTIKLIIKDVVYDELIIAVRGDLDGDALVAATDLVALKNIILGKEEKTYINSKIADLDLDELIAATDLVALKNYILGKASLN